MNRLPGNIAGSARSWTMVALAMAAVCVCAKTSQADATADQVRERRQKIATQMTEADRARLKSNFAKFDVLPKVEKERLRELDQQLKADRRSGGNLDRVMKDYMEWLEPLSPGEREELRRETDPSRRAQRVTAMVEKQRERADLMERRAPGRWGLNPADLDAVLGAIEDHLRERQLRPDRQLAELKTKKGLWRHAAILELAFGREGPDGTVQQPLRSLPPELVEKMQSAVSNVEQRKRLKDGDPRPRLFFLINGGIRAEFESLKPDEDTLARFLAQMTATERDNLLRQPLDRQKPELFDRYREQHPEKYPRFRAFDAMREAFGADRFMRRGGFPGGRSREGQNPRRPN